MATVCSAPECGKPLKPATGSRPRKYCDAKCRRKAYTARQSAPAEPVVEAPAEPGPVEVAVGRELELREQQASALGAAALTLARRIDRGGEAGPGLASLVKQLEATLRSIVQAAKDALPSPVDSMRDELAQRRRQRSA